MVSEAALDPELENERQLVEEAKAGNPKAMRPIFERYADPLYGTIILPRLGDPTTAEDVLRDTFITAIEKIHKFKWTGRSIYAWLRQIAINKVYDVHRKSKRARRLANAVANETATHTDVADGADAKLIAAEERGINRQRIADTLAQLTDRYRLAIELRLIKELSREECAEELGITVGNFDVVLHRAVRSFRKHFGDRDNS
ncbi:MAG: RNA polymerase sigma factor [Deltaproteobacteria bacterium]|nr:RNA polymerase sigma factor [Deltaproteobacteria bacterium]